MSEVGQIERRTQQRLVKLFTEDLGYRYLGDWRDRAGNSNVEVDVLSTWLHDHRGVSDHLIPKILRVLERACNVGGPRTLYDSNRDVYEQLRYGVKVKPYPGQPYTTVWLIDWKNVETNDFAIAEEVTITGEGTKRPDLVLYVNGIALGVIELKRSTVSVAEGIRQNLDNQKKEFIEPFFSTIQLIMAGNDTEGLRYGVIETPEKYYLFWKEDGGPDNALDRSVKQLCRKERLLEILHDFTVFDAGVKKTCRHNQYFGVKASQERVKTREGGIVWHTQGSGKSLTMIWLAKWIRENVKDSRVLILTDRTELDQQIEMFFKGVSENIYRTKSGADLVQTLGSDEEWLVCSLIHKFGRAEESGVDEFVAELRASLPKDFKAKGDIFVFVDECHRTQSGKLHEAMMNILPGAMLVGFTGTPLLKKDKQKSIEVFGPYIHTYKYDEAVEDGIVLDLQYEARDIDQKIASQDKIDQWFESKTRSLTDLAKAQVKKRWGTLKKVLSAKERLEKIVYDIAMDMEMKDRLRSGHGNALLVSGSIYQACRFYEMFQKTDLKGKCAIVTSYKPSPGDVKGEATGEGTTEPIRQYEIYRKMLAEHFDEPEDKAVNRVEEFEKNVKDRFVKEPGRMKLLIVVDKLLTGFDSPPATYLYIDKKMRDHGLFQAICRVNRLHTEDKEYGYVIDYKDLFKSLEKSIHDYTGEAFEGYDADDVRGLLKDRLEKARERLDERREAIKALCEGVEPPKDSPAYIRFFCGDEATNKDALKDTERKRVVLYKLAGEFLRAYGNLANEMEEAGYDAGEANTIKKEVEHYEKVREEVKLASGDYVDMKMFEPAMRHLLDTYIRAEDSVTLSAFEEMPLVQLLVQKGPEAVQSLPKGIRSSKEATAETIENNVRRLIIDEMAVNPKYYEKMSALLDALIEARRKEAMDYKQYLEQIADLAKKVTKSSAGEYPASIGTGPLRALYDNLDNDEERALRVDAAIRKVKKEGWRGNKFKEREVRIAIRKTLGDDENLVNAVFEIARNQHDY